MSRRITPPSFISTETVFIKERFKLIIYFYTKNDCSLCDKGFETLRILQKTYHFSIEKRDIYTQEEWLEKYHIRIPVIETEDGIVLDEGIVSFNHLEEKMTHLFSRE
ncbi:glutaredoxin family protein [Salipaludibacillus sp. LMS25]|uniref:glutaredoxin family protein n=1 Tax=Salipaludibacillus sp. LMS25 TaxID=2924031 RepID=UPI0034E93D90